MKVSTIAAPVKTEARVYMAQVNHPYWDDLAQCEVDDLEVVSFSVDVGPGEPRRAELAAQELAGTGYVFAVWPKIDRVEIDLEMLDFEF